ncbi:MAG TPA: cytochrome c [Blastocatellia bacterium]|nr:cytochrome c [Blastocatellia bacterium]
MSFKAKRILFRIALGLIIYLAISFSPAGSAPPGQVHQHPGSSEQRQPAATPERLMPGRRLYERSCAACHGSDGRAQTVRASAMKVRPADLTALHEMTDDEIYQVITDGIATSGMPSFKNRLSDNERRQIAQFVQTLRRQPAETAHQAHHHDHTATPSPQDQPPAADSHSADHQPHAEHGAAGMMINTVTGGPFRSMRAIGSGTSLQPASTPMWMWHFSPGEWMLMLHTDMRTGFNYQSGPRGVGRAESENWLMLMAERSLGPGRLMLRGMLSAEPLTAPHGGFPQLFQTGETYRRRPIIDAQHPHDLVMELAASYSVPLSENVSVQLYGGPVGEPALGPVAFMHRASAIENPAAPLGHHWQDSTHITHGVITGSLTAWKFRFEASGFQGREPDEDRVAIEFGRLDSYSIRTWFTPTPNWAMQFSYGHLTDPEVVTPGDLDRMTASLTYNRPLANGNWATSLIWGRNAEEHGNSNSYLLESTVRFRRRNHLYTRLELLDKSGLLSDNIFGRPGLIRAPVVPPEAVHFRPPAEFERTFRVGAFTFGGVHDFIDTELFRVGLGADVTFYHQPSALTRIYGRNPVSTHVFLRFRPGEMR